MISISDIMGGDDSTDSTNDSDANEASGSDELREACEALGADYDHASDYVDVHGKKDDLIEFAKALEGDDELAALHEAYRRMNDVHRIILNWLRNDSRSFTDFTGAFYGDSDDPEPETYNFVQQQVRAEDNGNLIFYRALFPEPREEYWDSEPVCWHEFDALRYDTDSDNQVDSHIYVGSNWASEYSGFTVEVDGEDRPRPPANDEIADFTSDGSNESDDSDSGSNVATKNAPFDPAEFNIPDLEDELDDVDYDEQQLRAALNMEKEGKQRKGAKGALREELDAVEAAQSDGGSEQEELSDAGKAGEINSKTTDEVPPDKIIELVEAGMTKDQIVEIGPEKIHKLLDGGFNVDEVVAFYG